jgi:glycerophosphoryl diester phosphodiesterase
VTSFRTDSGPLLYAHRGAPLEQPENTLESFACALAAGADVLELDVHMTRDGHIVVSHDPTGARMAKVDLEIRTVTLSEIKRWPLVGPRRSDDRVAGRVQGQHQVQDRARGRVPTLAEVLSAFPDALLNVDVKQVVPDMLPALLSLIAQHGAEQRVLLTSFHSRVTRRIRRLGYAGATGLGRGEVAQVVFAPAPLQQLWPVQGHRMQVPLRSGPFALDRAKLVRKAHRLGLAVDFWVVNDSAVAQRLLELGANGIVTDDPRRIAELYAQSPYTSAWRARRAGAASARP